MPRTPHEMMAEAMRPGTKEMHVTQEEMDAMMEHLGLFASVPLNERAPREFRSCDYAGESSKLYGALWYLKDEVTT